MQDAKRSVGIVGGGPGGLTLARILAMRGIAFTVFELDEHPLARPQGGSLDLHAESGQRALREAGLEAQFKAVARYDDQGGAIYNHQGTLQFEEPFGSEGDRPEIDRTQLRSILIDSLSKEAIRWGSKVSAVEPLVDGRYRVVGPEGSLGDFDLVVGADGAWSKVRPLVSKAVPTYTGILNIELCIDDVDAKHPALAALIPHGKIGAIGNCRALIAQRSSNSHVRVYLMFRVPEERLQKGILDLSSPARARAELKALLPGWAPSLLSFIDACNDTMVARPIVTLPAGHRWNHRPGVTLLGDAAHLMSPFGGEGVNLAMLDGMELALGLAANSDWSHAVAAYEERMCSRAAPEAADALQGLHGFISENALEHSLAHFGAVQNSAGADLGQPGCENTPGEVFETHIAKKTKDADTRKEVNAVFRFDLSGPNGGTWIVDFKEDSAGVRRADEPGQCTIAMRDDDFVAMLAGEFTPRMAFMRGRLKVKGDMSLAMKLGQILAA
jgi:2-polyprenyl-6-methoxyphenol hydroxylase-like FAD-dependent oxidoreductase/putative sterol carrier protein